jgi:uncharacterized protein (DUF433 family)
MNATDADTVVMAFSEEQVERLTGVTRQQLRYWDRTDFFTPSLASEDRHLPYSRLYSFRDVVALQVLNALRREGDVPLQHLRQVREELRHRGNDLWAKTTLFVLNRRVVIYNPDIENREDVLSRQAILKIPLQVVRRDMEDRVRLLWERPAGAIGKITRKRAVAKNAPVIAGTRVPVRAIKAFASEGYTVAQILDEYPTLTVKDVRAAIEYQEAA